ncbi:hypothetical protein BDZ91DRAFT_724843 [Kalaharituber pfeilii]|nr:hypothetical protein BDZ91DRAFT_724843 [Kalaharituber pfeilii]
MAFVRKAYCNVNVLIILCIYLFPCIFFIFSISHFGVSVGTRIGKKFLSRVLRILFKKRNSLICPLRIYMGTREESTG